VSGRVPAVQLRSLLGIFNFRGDDVFKSVKILSGGEKSRLILAKLLINPPNFVLLDEPTTHLDIDGVEALTNAFQQYEGTICFISHDLFFVREIANNIIEINNGQIKNYPGGLEYYLDKKKQGETLGQRSQKVQEDKKKQKRDERKKNRQKENQKIESLHAQHKQAKKRLRQIPVEIKAVEEQMKELETESYVKARVLSNSYGKDPDLLKEYGKRLKEIPKLLRELAGRIKELQQEEEKVRAE